METTGNTDGDLNTPWSLDGGDTPDKALGLTTIPKNIGYGWFTAVIKGNTYQFQVTDKFDYVRGEYIKTFVFNDKALNPSWGQRLAPRFFGNSDLHKLGRTPLKTILKAMIAPEDVPINVIDSYTQSEMKDDGNGIVATRAITLNIPEVYKVKYAEPYEPPPFPFSDDSGLRLATAWTPDSQSNWTGFYNPPAHTTSRGQPVPVGQIADEAIVIAEEDSILQTLVSATSRGYIYQDLDTAADASGNPKASDQLWGFRFMYNPSSISYTNAVNTNVDMTLTQDVGTMLVGSQQVSFELILNRVMDVSVLKDIALQYAWEGRNPTSQWSQGFNYPRSLTKEEVLGLFYRGTEYDLEFLYRVINGDPEWSPSVLQTPTSDSGFLVGAPVWVRLNDNMVYKGIITNISVKHTMFNRQMVPILSTVGITLYRIPTPFYATDAQTNEKLKTKYNTQAKNGRVVLPYNKGLSGGTTTAN